MRWARSIARRWSSRRRQPPDLDLEEELRFHVEAQVQANLDGGMAPDEAKRAANVRLGNTALIREDTAAVWRWAWWDAGCRDVRLATRRLVRQPGFSLLAVLILALGTGANTVVFSAANAVLFKSPLPDPDGVVWTHFDNEISVRYEDYQNYRDSAEGLTLAAFQSLPLGIAIDDGPELAQVGVVSGNYFTVTGISPSLGRMLSPGDERDDQSERLAVLSHTFWQRRLDGDPDIVGRSIRVNGAPFVIVGVAMEDFHGTSILMQDDLWIPSRSADLAFDRVQMIGLVLLVACFNLASLVLARSAGRTQEIGVRLAVGAGRAQLVRQLVTEGILLTGVGMLLGLGLAALVVDRLNAMSFTVSIMGPFSSRVSLGAVFDWRVLAFTGLAAGGAVLTFALAPAPQTTRTDVVTALRREVSLAGVRRLARTRALLITAQLAVSVLLLTATGLLLQSWRNAASTDIGFDPNRVLAVRVDPQLRGYDREEGQRFYEALVSRLTNVPGAVSTSIAGTVPMSGLLGTTVLIPPSQPDPRPEELGLGSPHLVGRNLVAPGYFSTLGIPMLSGRDFTMSDRRGSPPVVIVNEAFARQRWPGLDPVGQRLRRPATPFSSETVFEVVAVVANAKYLSVGEPLRGHAYLPLLQSYSQFGSVLIRSTGDPMGLLPAVRDVVADLDPDMATTGADPLRELTRVTLLPISVAGMILGSIGALTLLLAAVGVAGVLGYLVRQRTREFGVRIALGARPQSIVALVAGHSARWMLAGLVLGFAAAVGLNRFVAGLLYDVEPNDPISFALTAVALLLVGGLASFVPVRHALRTDPMTALRAE